MYQSDTYYMVPASQEFSRIDNWCRSASRINVALRLGRSSPFAWACGKRVSNVTNRMEARPYEIGVNRVEKFLKHGRVLFIPVLGVSLPLCKSGFGQTPHNEIRIL